MDKLFLSVLNMSLTGAFAIAAICLVRLPLKKAPKAFSYCLWAVAGFRLVFPFSIESIFSLMPIKPHPIPADIAMQPIPRIDTGIPFVNNAVSSVLPAATPTASANPLQIWTAIGAYVWLVGIAVMLIYSIVSMILLKRGLRGAGHLRKNIYESSSLKTPLVVGLFRPRIFIPAGLSGHELRYVLLHEQTHIRRHDHIVKVFAYFVLCLHWFNPLAWVAFLLMSADMEMSCDERVLNELGGDIKNDYSMSLVRIASGRCILNGSPLAFGEGGMKERIKRVLKFKRPSRIIITLAVVLVALFSAGFAVNQAGVPDESPTITVKTGVYDIDWTVGKNKWNSAMYDRLDTLHEIMMRDRSVSNLAYVKNGEQITITIDGRAPDSVTLSEHILREDGSQKYNIDGITYNVSFGIFNRRAVYTIKPNYATALSSFGGDYEPGNTIKGYRLVCSWGGNECEYAFIIRGDAAITMEPIVGKYEFHITTREEAREIVGGHYPDADKIAYREDAVISHTNPPAPVDVYTEYGIYPLSFFYVFYGAFCL